MICTIVGNYGRHMAFATDPPFCMAYPLHFVHKNDPAQMTFRSQQNHPISFTVDSLLVHQLLVHGIVHSVSTWWIGIMGAFSFLGVCVSLLISFHRLLSLAITTTPYRDPKTGEDAPFVTVGPFTSMDTLFHGTASDLELYTAEEVIAFRNAGIFKSSNISQSDS